MHKLCRRTSSKSIPAVWVIAVLLTCQPEQRGFAEAVHVSVLKQVEAGRRGVQEVTGLRLGFQGVVPRQPGVSTKNKCGRVPEGLVLLPFGEPQLAAEAHVQEEVRSVGGFKGDTRCVCEGEDISLRTAAERRGGSISCDDLCIQPPQIHLLYTVPTFWEQLL